MSEIKTFSFDKHGADSIKEYKYGRDWPVVYLIEGDKEMYVGESIHVYSRTKQHLENEDRSRLNKIHVISDDEYNKSATLDTESSLIEYLAADVRYKLQNSNKGLQNHNFFDREKYQAKFELLWKELQRKQIAENDLVQIRNSDLFKYSPYKTLTDDQFIASEIIMMGLAKNTQKTFLIHGGPGTGKTVLAIYLIKQLVEKGNKNIALIIAMTSLRQTLKKVFKHVPGLSASMVVGPNEVTKKKYDILVVDEAHRLRQRKNIPNFGSFDKTNKKLGLGPEGTELDWILMSAKQVILFFDEKQSVRPSDIMAEKMKSLSAEEYFLDTQVRVKGGEHYLRFIDSLLEQDNKYIRDFYDYDFRVYDDVAKMVEDIKIKDGVHGLGRVVAGYAWKWNSRDNKNVPDIVIGDAKLFWNRQLQDWVNSPNAINEVGCIHTIQGYDLNYAGVIIGPDIYYDQKTKQIRVNREQYFDANGKRSVWDDKELKRYIINIYKTLLTRGILGTYVYIVDPALREYFKQRTNEVHKPKSKNF